MKILSVDDEVRYPKLIKAALEMDGHEVSTAGGGEEGLRLVKKESPDLVFADLNMPGMDGLALLSEIRKLPDPPHFVMVTAQADVKPAVAAIKAGAYDYLTKPFEIETLSAIVGKVAELRGLIQKTRDLEALTRDKFSFKNILGRSAPMAKLMELMEKVKDLETTVLIRGESGTGKELVARALHFESRRKAGPFVAVNCAAIPENLLESELFGHKRGAFTGADRDREGKFAAAENGTLFLDEVGELTPEIQAKLLRVLQEREYYALGDNKPLVTNARMVAATNRNLEEAVATGEFREDLYHRLNIFPLHVPPLSERRDDVAGLAAHFLKKFGHTGPEIGKDVSDLLLSHSWPGNVRELENAMERAVILSGKGALKPEHFTLTSPRPALRTASGAFSVPPEGLSLDQVEKELLLSALSLAKDNKTRAAELLGISRRAIYSKMKTHGIAGV